MKRSVTLAQLFTDLDGCDLGGRASCRQMVSISTPFSLVSTCYISSTVVVESGVVN